MVTRLECPLDLVSSPWFGGEVTLLGASRLVVSWLLGGETSWWQDDR